MSFIIYYYSYYYFFPLLTPLPLQVKIIYNVVIFFSALKTDHRYEYYSIT